MNAFDAAILDGLNAYAGLAPRFDRVVVWLSFEHMVKGGIVAAVLWGLWFARGQAAGTLRREQLIAGMAAGLVGEIVARALSHTLPFRPRPLHNEAFDFTPVGGLDPRFLDGWSAFPSDHAVLFFALATTGWYVSRAAGAWLYAFVAVVICLPRIYLGLHHPTDILAGAAIGIAVAALLQQPALRTPLARPLLAWEQRAPGAFYALAIYFTLEYAVLFEGLRGALRLVRRLLA